MTDESPEQKRQNIIDRFDREQIYFEKAFEEGRDLLNKSLEEKNLAGIDLARKNMAEASEILGDLVKGKNEALKEFQAAENSAQTVNQENLGQAPTLDTSEEKNETQEKSEEQDYYNGYGM